MAPSQASSVGAPVAASFLPAQPASAPGSDAAIHPLASSRSDHPPWKRAVDITCICLALPALVFVVVFIAMVIRVVSPGPIFFRQERAGYRRARFMCWKFRTMEVNSDETVHRRHVLHQIEGNKPMATIDSPGDSRLFPFGAILRASGMDDLPQLINVCRGEMSLVGPRPCTTYELETCLPRQRVRFEALPGLTGPWRVSDRGRTTLNELIELDIRYVQSRSLRLDLGIMAKTLVTFVQQVARLSRRATPPAAVPAG